MKKKEKKGGIEEKVNIQQIITSLTPINTTDKVDTLVELVKSNGIKMYKPHETAIKIGINKLSIQKYFIEKYGHLFSNKKTDTEKKERKKKMKSNRSVHLIYIPSGGMNKRR